MSRFSQLWDQNFWGSIWGQATIVIDAAHQKLTAASVNKLVTLPAVVVRHRHTQQVSAIGSAAQRLRGKIPPQFELVYPIDGGRVSDTAGLQILIRELRQQLVPKAHLFDLKQIKLEILTYPHMSALEYRVWEQTCTRAGFDQIEFREKLARVHQFLKQHQYIVRDGSFILVESDTLLVGCVVEQQLVYQSAVSMQKYDLVNTIREKIRQEYQVEVGWSAVERVLVDYQTLAGSEQKKEFKVTLKAKHIVTGLPVTQKVTLTTIESEVIRWSEQVARLVSSQIGKLESGVVSDLLDQGLVVIGELLVQEELVTALEAEMQCQVIVPAESWHHSMISSELAADKPISR